MFDAAVGVSANTIIMKWLKTVAQDLAKPFGDDDDDLDMCSFLTMFADNLFTIADFAPCNLPLKSWSRDESEYDKLKGCFSSHILHYESMGKKFTTKFKRLMRKAAKDKNESTVCAAEVVTCYTAAGFIFGTVAASPATPAWAVTQRLAPVRQNAPCCCSCQRLEAIHEFIFYFMRPHCGYFPPFAVFGPTPL
uniref:Uncharacterized protein n=1 Tax=Romanomermis culicivorax TaxID=13658 RepID=A0A915HVL1_ROMCU